MTKFAEHQYDERPTGDRPWWEGGRMWEAVSFGFCGSGAAGDPMRSKVMVGVSQNLTARTPATVGLTCTEYGHASAELMPEEARRIASFLLQAADFIEANNARAAVLGELGG